MCKVRRWNICFILCTLIHYLAIIADTRRTRERLSVKSLWCQNDRKKGDWETTPFFLQNKFICRDKNAARLRLATQFFLQLYCCILPSRICKCMSARLFQEASTCPILKTTYLTEMRTLRGRKFHHLLTSQYWDGPYYPHEPRRKQIGKNRHFLDLTKQKLSQTGPFHLLMRQTCSHRNSLDRKHWDFLKVYISTLNPLHITWG